MFGKVYILRVFYVKRNQDKNLLSWVIFFWLKIIKLTHFCIAYSLILEFIFSEREPNGYVDSYFMMFLPACHGVS